MAEESYVAVAAQYAGEDDAVADFDRVRAHFAEDASHEHGPFDAVVIRRGVDGELSMVRRDDGGKNHGTRKGLAVDKDELDQVVDEAYE